jgi:hypothetical protein
VDKKFGGAMYSFHVEDTLDFILRGVVDNGQRRECSVHKSAGAGLRREA